MPAAVPVGLMVIERRPTYLVVQWTAPPSPFRGNYRLTYGPLGGMMTTITVSGVSLDVTVTITGLQPFTNYRVSVQASSAPVVDYGPTLSGVFATLPEAEIPPNGTVPTLVVPQVGDGSSGIVEIIIPLPPFPRQAILRYTSTSLHALHSGLSCYAIGVLYVVNYIALVLCTYVHDNMLRTCCMWLICSTHHCNSGQRLMQYFLACTQLLVTFELFYQRPPHPLPRYLSSYLSVLPLLTYVVLSCAPAPLQSPVGGVHQEHSPNN